MYKIGELSKLCRIPVKTLRYYDSMGLLPPDQIDKFTGYRYYSAAKLSDCYRILALKEPGFILEEIKAHFSLPKDRLSALITAKEQELCRLKTQTEQHIHVLRELQSALKEDASMFDIVVRKSDEIRLTFSQDHF
ncbi:MAG: MerR family transcriptional regulator [Ruminococcus sp.]|nr:MerR family transcriptional regulator [Ruminococcus sp.]